MRLTEKYIIGALLVFFTTSVYASPSYRGLYFGGSVSALNIKGIDHTFNGAVIKLGYDLTNFLGIEAHGGSTSRRLFSDPGSDNVLGFQFRNAGVYARINFRSVNSMIYALAGYSYFKIHEEFTSNVNPASNWSYDDSLSGLSYGFGAELFGSTNTSLTANWIQLIKEKDQYGYEWNAQTFYIGITHYFNTQKTTYASF
jgi:hypothetical protein